jgi:P-type Ca2+ transporter type 2C
VPVSKTSEGGESSNLKMGTLVSRGHGWMIVEQTGMNTEFGKLAKNLQSIQEEKTPLQNKLDWISKIMVGIGIFVCLVVVWLSLRENDGWYQAWMNGVSLAVAVIPEGLPAVIAITLAAGSQRLSKQKAIVRRLGAIEALGAATVIATDKTGTITQNVMEVKQLYINRQLFHSPKYPALVEREFALLATAGVLCSSSVLVFKHDHGTYDVIGDQTEGALLKMAQEVGLVPDLVRQKHKMLREYPFNSQTRTMTVVTEDSLGKNWVFTKGAVAKILAICKLDQDENQHLYEEFNRMSSQGLRVLAIAYKPWKKEQERSDLESNLKFLGLVGIADPLRPEAALTLRHAREMGVRVIMITGDSELTANAIATEVGLIQEDEEIITGDELDRISDDQLISVVGRVRVFASIMPGQKLRIVKALQGTGELVVMTGDGVNDAMALKQADVGIAMGKTGTDVARETADMVLQDDNLLTIVGAIESGKKVMSNISQCVQYLLSCNLGEMLTILFAVGSGFSSPLLPGQILWVNLVTDGLPAIALAIDSRQNVEYSQKLLGRKQSAFILIAGLLVGLGGFASYLIWGRLGAFNTLVILQMIMALLVRGFRKPDKWLVGAIVISLSLQFLVTTLPFFRSIFNI